MKVSVIVPIYNVEQYVRECVKSILNQSLDELEIILVNDGTKDNSIVNIQDLIDSHDNIILVEKENSGLSAARNAGLRVATGDYISFIDSDDYIEPLFLETLYKEAYKNNLDICIGGYTDFFTDNMVPRLRNTNLLDVPVTDGQDILYNQINNNDYRMEVWTNLYKHDFLKTNKLEFVEGILHEDEEFTPRVLLMAKRVKIISTNDYIYRHREDSIMNSKPSIKHINSIFFIIENLIHDFNLECDIKKKKIYSWLIKHLTECYIDKILLSNIDNKVELLHEIKKKNIRNIICYYQKMNLKNSIKYLILGYNPSIYLYYFNFKQAQHQNWFLTKNDSFKLCG